MGNFLHLNVTLLKIFDICSNWNICFKMILYFTVPPEIREFVNTTGTEGAAATLTCKAYGDPIPNIIFKKDDQVFTDVAQEVRIIVN